jgi:uncharacterized membrane protein YgdD (TMEM256/DUF423 family)
MTSYFGFLGAVMGAIGVAMGAFGAHGLKDKVEPRYLEIWNTAAMYQLFHALALVLVAALYVHRPSLPLRISGLCFFFGMLVFSGSLYTLVLTGKGWLGAITPLGGAALIVGWIALAKGLWPVQG